jgi:hypothetical protein
LEAIRVKILVQGQPDMESLKVELTTESDLFFHYTHVANEESFRVMQDEQKLMVDFSDYGNVLARSLNAAIKEPHRWVTWCSFDSSALLLSCSRD